MIFKSKLSDLAKVKVGTKSKQGKPGKPGGNVHVIPDDESSDPNDSADAPEGDQNDPKDVNGDASQPSKIPSVTIGGNKQPIVDIIPEDSSFKDMYKDAEVLDGSDKSGTKAVDRNAKIADLKKAEQAGAEQIESSSGGKPGKGFGGRRVAVAGDIPVKTDWASILINLLKTKRPGPPTWSKVHKKTFGLKMGGRPVMRPGRTDKPDIGKIVVAIDTSGSIDDTILNGFLSELKRLFSTFPASTTFGVKVILWADGPYAVSNVFKSNEYSVLQKWVTTNVVSGGTSIDDVVKLINSFTDLNQYIATAWFTDGQIDDLATPLPDMDQIFIIQGYISEYTKKFKNDVQRYRPAGKKVTMVRTDY
jgi:predicted metal-dependent peptidase